MTMYQEVEVKFYAYDLDIVASQLQKIGAQPTVPRVYERNVRYENAEKTLSKRGIVIRMRQDNRVRLTYKEPAAQIYDGVDTRFEAEVEVSDYDAMELILGRLGYHPYLVYEKYRTTYVLNGVEIVLDEMPYGNFVELEGEPGAIKSVIPMLQLKDLPRITMNYIQLFENVCHNLGLHVRDLTFENFKGISVPLSAFDPPD